MAFALKIKINPVALRLGLACTLLGWALGLGAPFIPYWKALELKVFDAYSVLTAPKSTQMPIFIVGIDEATSAQLNQRWPFPREMHAALIDRLVEMGAAVIAFDVQFSEPSTPEGDAAMTASIYNAGNVVLASKMEYHETGFARMLMRMDPVPDFTAAGATAGLADTSYEIDKIPRTMEQSEDAFWRQCVRTLIRVNPDAGLVDPGIPGNAMIRYLGPRETFPYVSYYQVLNGDEGIPPDYFAGALVLIGRNSSASADINAAQADSFETPFTFTTGQLTPGVEIHATQIENALLANMIEPAPRNWDYAIVSAAMFMLFPVLVFWHPLRSSALTLLIASATVGVTYMLFQQPDPEASGGIAGLANVLKQNRWAATAGPLAAIFFAYMATGTGSFLTERRRADAIRGMFNKYVSPKAIQQMIDDPALARLGGQRRELSVLFCDLAGFTSLSEKLPPEGVGQLINTYLNAMTAVIHGREGTVDKFIGDAVMAFWGAPLDDPDHALHAMQACIEMQKAMDALQPQFEALGVDNLKLRIGLNSGPAIVGNMGSDSHFSYTALGDVVNLASRLEGANKAFGTPILVAESTADLVRRSYPLRQVDRVRVKGKEHPVDVFTPCDDEDLIAITAAAWHSFLARDFTTALALARRIRSDWPGDHLAELLEERVQECIDEPPGEGWDGSIGLDKL